METVYYIAVILVCFHGECTRFESAPYSRDIGIINCTKQLEHVFVNQVGPFYDKIIDFTVDTPEDINITYASCDIAK